MHMGTSRTEVEDVGSGEEKDGWKGRMGVAGRAAFVKEALGVTRATAQVLGVALSQVTR